MKSKIILMTCISLIIAATFSCSKSSNSNSGTCTVSTGDTGPLASNTSVPYSASATGGATISSLTYQDSTGMTTVKNPALPFSKTVNLPGGATVSISATGNAKSGEITVASNGNYPNSASCP
ncbi:MAG TPA: hypothetical protein VGH64_14580 [Puia sp.]